MYRRNSARSRSLMLLLTVFCLLASHASAKVEYEVRMVNGSVLAWRPWAGDWDRVRRGARLPLGTLIQTAGFGDLMISPTAENVGKLTSANLAFVSPTMFRLTPNIMRKFQVSETSVTDEADVGRGGDAKGKAIEDEILPITLAWDRQDGLSFFMSAVKEFAKGVVTRKDLAVSGAKSSLFVRNAVRLITIKFPRDGSLIPSNNGTEQIIISWDHDSDGVRPMVNVFVWKKDQDRGVPIAMTNAAVIPVTLKSGGYFIQLVAPNLAFQSKTIYVIVD